MLGLGIGEIILLLVVAIIVLGPDKLPNAIIEVAKFFRVIKKTMQDARDTLDREVNLSELKREADEYKEKLQNTIDVTKDVKDAHLIQDIKNDMNDIEHLFADFEPKIVRPNEQKKDSNIDSKNIESNISKTENNVVSSDTSIKKDSKPNENINETKEKQDSKPKKGRPKKNIKTDDTPQSKAKNVSNKKNTKVTKDSKNKSNKKDSKTAKAKVKKTENIESKTTTDSTKPVTQNKSLANDLRNTFIKQRGGFE